MNFEKLTIKHCISDLPRILNKNFDAVKEFINKVFTESESDVNIGSDNIHLNGTFTTIKSNELKAGNIKILHDGEYITLESYIQNIVRETIENAVNSTPER